MFLVVHFSFFKEKMAMFSFIIFSFHHSKIKHKSCRPISGSMDNQTAIVPYDFDNPIYQVDEDGEEDDGLLEELAMLLLQESKVIQPHQEAIEIINLGSEEDKKEVKICASLDGEVKKKQWKFTCLFISFKLHFIIIFPLIIKNPNLSQY